MVTIDSERLISEKQNKASAEGARLPKEAMLLRDIFKIIKPSLDALRPFGLINKACQGPRGPPIASPVALQLRAPPKVSARAPAHRSYHFRGVKLKSCIKKIHHSLYISKQANVRIKHADTEGASHKKFGTDARVQ